MSLRLAWIVVSSNQPWLQSLKKTRKKAQSKISEKYAIDNFVNILPEKLLTSLFSGYRLTSYATEEHFRLGHLPSMQRASVLSPELRKIEHAAEHVACNSSTVEVVQGPRVERGHFGLQDI